METRTTDRGMTVEISVLQFEKRYDETGEWNPFSGKYEINYSSLLSRLIGDTGRFTLHYASDLFIMWEALIGTLRVLEEKSDTTYVFGIRQDGVDDAVPVINALKNGRSDYYRAIWGVRIMKDGDSIRMSMEKLDRIKAEQKAAGGK